MSWKVALPMYNVSPRLQRDHEALLAALMTQAGLAGEVELVRDAVLPTFWTRPDMLFSQSCGYPYVDSLHDRVTLLATPCYDVPGCRGSDHASALVVRADSGIATLADARGRVAAVNERHSNSGMNLLRHAVAPLARAGHFFGGVHWSGSHAASLRMVREGRADIAAIDSVTLAYLREDDPAALASLAVLDHTAAAPGLPMIGGGAAPSAWLSRLRNALLAPGPALQAAMRPLHIRAFDHCDATVYARIRDLEQEARKLGYSQLG